MFKLSDNPFGYVFGKNYKKKMITRAAFKSVRTKKAGENIAVNMDDLIGKLIYTSGNKFYNKNNEQFVICIEKIKEFSDKLNAEQFGSIPFNVQAETLKLTTYIVETPVNEAI